MLYNIRYVLRYLPNPPTLVGLSSYSPYNSDVSFLERVTMLDRAQSCLPRAPNLRSFIYADNKPRPEISYLQYLSTYSLLVDDFVSYF